MSFRLSQAFISKYEGKQPNWGFNGLGYVIYKRSYARYYCRDCGSYLIDGEETQQTCDTCSSTNVGVEEFWQTCRRVVEGTFELQRRHVNSIGTRWNAQKAQASAQEMFKLMWDFKFLPPGRGLWAMGSPIVMDRGNGAALFNCGFTSTQNIDYDFAEPFCFLFEASAHGVGVGFDTRGEGKVTIVTPKIGQDTLVVEDSREGWSVALRRVLQAYVGKGSLPAKIDYSLVRPKGAPIKTFGGTASGHEALRELLEVDVPKVLTPGVITSTHIVDLQNVVGKCVVAGGARRSSEIALARIDDEEFTKLKLDDAKLQDYRWNSNNSHFVPPMYSEFSRFQDPIMQRGEPGFVFLHNIQAYGRMAEPPTHVDFRAVGVNPCGEQSLEDGELCNVVETFPAHCDSFEEFKRVLKYSYLYGKTVTLTKTPWARTNEIMLRNRRIGLSMSGIIQNINKVGFAEHIRWCDEGYAYLKELDKIYSEWLCIRPSIKMTTVKPSGCRPDTALTTTSLGVLTLKEILKDHPSEAAWGDVSGIQAIQDSGTTQVTRSFRNGDAEVYSVRTSYNHVLESTAEHMWFVKERRLPRKPAKPVNAWVRTDELQPRDVIEAIPGLYTNTEHAALTPLELHDGEFYHNVKACKLPSNMSPDLAWLLGYLWGDDAMSEHKSRLRWVDSSIDNLQKAQRIILELFGLDAHIRELSDRRAHTLEIGSRFLWEWLRVNGIRKYGDSGLEDIPLVVRTSSTEDIVAFIAGLLDADGCVHSSSKKGFFTYTIATAYESFAKHLQNVCFAVGLVLGRSHNTKGSNLQASKSIWLLTQSTHTTDTAFSWLLQHSNKVALAPHKAGFDGWAHQQQTHHHKVMGEVESIEPIGVLPTFDIETNSHWYYAGGFKSHNTVSLLCGATPGIHYPHSEYILRRVRFTNGSTLLKALQRAGYPSEPDYYDKNVTVVGFPIQEANFSRGKNDTTIWEQIENAAQMQAYWSDNSVSITVDVKPHEADQIPLVLDRYQTRLKTVSFLPTVDHGYVQPPYEEITKEKFEELNATIKKLDLSKAEHEVTDRFCDSDVCQI